MNELSNDWSNVTAAIAECRANGTPLSEAHRRAVMVVLIKFSDISNAGKPWPQVSGADTAISLDQ